AQEERAGGSSPPRRARSRRELRSRHWCLRKELREVKKLHGEEQDRWAREKELLLRQVADIQGRENRRTLLELRVTLHELRLRLRREETERRELQLRRAHEQCAWQRERAELQRRIAQLEARGKDEMQGGQMAPSAGPRDALERDREEQKRLLADTHATAVALRLQLESSEQDWAQHKADLLERFDAERREWEDQLGDMQRKIEELYDEVKAHRRGTEVGPNSKMHDGDLKISLQSSRTSSSIFTNFHSSNDESETPNQHSNICTDSSHHESERNNGPAGNRSNGCTDHYKSSEWDFYAAELEDILKGCLRKGSEHSSPEQQTCSSSSSTTWPVFSSPSPTKHPAFDSPSLDLQRCCSSPSSIKCEVCESPSLSRYQACSSSPQIFGLALENNRRRNIMALNTARQEISRVSKELCSYQDEIRKKSDFRHELFSFLHEFEGQQNKKDQTKNEVPDVSLSPVCDFQALEEQSWIHWEGAARDVDSSLPQRKTDAPPVPLRTTSWYPSSSTALESSIETKPISSVSADRKYSSPSVLRKFGAMSLENEGKTLMDSVVVSSLVPSDSKCNISCCHSQWSCDGSKFGSSKSSTYVPVRNCQSGAPTQEEGPACTENELPTYLLEQLQLLDTDFLSDRLRPLPLEVPSSHSNSARPWRNKTLEMKTAEFNRTVFHGEMGHSVEEDSLTAECVLQYPDTLSMHSIPKSLSETCEQNPEDARAGNYQNRNDSSFSAFSQSISDADIQSKGPRTRLVLLTGSPRTGRSEQGVDTWSKVLNEQPWRPGTLAAYPRPGESRSNYGAVERILRTYQGNCGSNENSLRSPYSREESDLAEQLELLDIEDLSNPIKRLHMPLQTTSTQSVTTSSPQESKDSSFVSIKKSFSRPVRPAKQRPPSRWANRSPCAPSAPSSATSIFTHKSVSSRS
ncbi:hypothetical protein Z043_102116, partial [Scleropages formosus]